MSDDDANNSFQEHHLENDTRKFMELWKLWCPIYLVLLMCVFAAGCTFVASWNCKTFYGAEVSFGGGGYGIWSLEDSDQRCQLWSVLFFAYKLDGPLQVARILSMIAMVASLAAVAILTQILPWGQLASWVVAIALTCWLGDSIAQWWRFNIWSTFFILMHLWMMLFVKCVLVQCYSQATLWNLARCLMLVSCGGACGIFCILVSNVCMCDELTNDDLEHTEANSNVHAFSSMVSKDCSGQCVLGPNSPIAIVSPCLWFVTWILTQSVSLERWTEVDLQASKQQCSDRPRLITATTIEASEEEEADDCQGDESESCHSETRASIMNQSFAVDIATSLSKLETKPEKRGLSDDEITQCTVPKDTKMKNVEDCDDCSIGSVDSTISTNSSPRQKPTRWRRVTQGCWSIVSVVEIGVLVVLLGAYVENKQAAMAPDTSYNFVTDAVCAFDPTGSYETFESAEKAVQAGYTVAHCGSCGECSNPSDIQRFVETRKTVADQAKQCSIQAIFGKDEELVECLEKEIGFTRSCTTCWAENMKNTAKHCMWTCLSSILTGIAKSNTVEDAHDYDWLNQCVFCDEKRSGPAFVKCSGVARRRLGIQSEFERNPEELCSTVQVNYLSDTWMQNFS